MVYRKTHMLLIGCFSLIISGVFPQEQKIADSLAIVYQNTSSGIDKYKLLTDLSFNETRDLKKGLQYAEELISLAEQTGNSTYLRIGYFLKGTKKRLLGNLHEALDAYFKSAEIATKAGHLKGEAEAYCAIADTYTVADNADNAKQYYNKAIITLRESKPKSQEDSINLASVLNNAGEAFRETQNYDSALLHFNEAKSIFDKANYLIGTAYCLGNIGMVYASIGKNSLAEENINEAIHILEETLDYYPISVYLISMSDVYLGKGDHQTALHYAVRSLYLAEQHGWKEQIADANLKMSQLYERAGNTKKALKHYKKYIAYRDSVNNIQIVRRMADERTNYEVSQKQLQVNLLKTEKRNQQIIVIALFIILSLTIMLLGNLYWFYISRSKEKLRLHQQELLKARLEIQEQTYLNISQELHDNIGQVLSLVKMNINTVGQIHSDVAKEKLAESTHLLTKAIQDLRDMSKTLNADYLNEIGLPNAIEQQLQALKRTGLYSTELSVQGDVDHYQPEKRLLIFRVVQELLNNIVKHANADNIAVSINSEAERLVIKVQDNGQGFDAGSQQQYPNKGLGLRNIHNRLKLIKGSIFFQSEPDKGTAAIVEILK